MSTASPSGPDQVSFRQARLELHRGVVGSSATISLLVALVLVGLLWRDAPSSLLLGWLAVLVLALCLRLGIARWHGRGQASAPLATWIIRYRLAYLVHGLVWGSLALLLMPQLDHSGFHVLLISLMTMTGTALVASAFDRTASHLFALPILVPVLLALHSGGDGSDSGLVAVLLLFVAAMAIAAHRTARAMGDTVRAQNASVERTAAAERSSAALADQYALLRQLLEGTRQGYWFIDTQGRTTDVNPAMCELLGRPREAVIGRAATEFFHGAELAVLQRELAARRQGKTGAYEIDIVRPDGSRVSALNHATPLLDAQGRAVGSVGLWTDLSAQKRVQTELRTFEWAVNSQVDRVSVVDCDQRILMVNDAWCEATGWVRADALGLLLGDVEPLSPTLGEALRACLVSFERRTVREVCGAGTMAGRWFETTLCPYRDEATGASCVVLVSHDITEQEASRLAVEAAAEDLRRTLNATGEAIFASDAEDPAQPVRFINEPMRQMWGLGTDPCQPVTPADILAAARPLFLDAKAELARVAEIVSGNQAAQHVLRLRDGRVLRRRCEVARVGQRMLRVWSFRDITVEDQTLQILQKSDAEQRRLLDAFPGYISSVDGQLRYRYTNARTAALVGRPLGEIIGRTTAEIMGAARAAVNAEEIARVRRGEVVRIERHYPATDWRPAMELEVTQVQGGTRPDGTEVFYAFGVDITARKQAELALAAARDEAERANRAKSQFLSQMSHELRTPLNAVDGFAQLLEVNDAPPLAGPQRGWVHQIRLGAQHLLGLINEVLDLGQVESGHLAFHIEPVALGPLAHECVAMLRPMALRQGLTLADAEVAAQDLTALADRARLRQVLLNLLGNAVKYNRADGEVRVTCRRFGDEVVVTVRDSGIGMDEAQRERLFQPFDRLGAERTKVEGTGIGLALSLRLVQAMNGRIEVRSTPGAGSEFSVHLPAATAQTAVESVSDGLEQEAPAPRRSGRVLYIEDNAVNVVLMQAMLAHLPEVQLRCATEPFEGLRIATSEPPDLVLLDIQLPGLNGFEVLHRLRAHTATASVPVVAVSANAMTADRQAALAAGFSDFLTKPLSLQSLHEVVRRELAAAHPTGETST